ncbi:MAG TPA: SDR family NAD(P)-dependent oxidoreductase [Mycobacteriales bacterium]|nr:SDR family NAD(P)-dependent oxidoreductase [Mycobacteriales bacterium]
MTSIQQPIGSPFSSTSTASDVLTGADLTDRLAVVTGGYSGVGLALVRALAEAGTKVVVPARRLDEARRVVAGIEGVEVGELDLSDLKSVNTFADQFMATGRSIDILVNCAGIMAPPEARVGPGWELQFATNHLGHFALTNRLWPALAANRGARVVSFSSRGHKFSDIQWDDLNFHDDYDKWKAYGQSKTANALFALQLDALGEPHGVRAFSLNPGGIKSNLQRYVSREDQVSLGWIDENGTDLITWKSAEGGAATAAWAISSTQLDGMGGVYLEDCEVAAITDMDAPDAMKSGVNPYATDPGAAARLWALSADLTGVDALTA